MSKSNYSNLPKRIYQSLLKIEKKIVTYPIEDKVKKFRQKLDDHLENRELLVVDKYGNQYYQYYSYHGLPTKRMVHINMKGFNSWEEEPLMTSWLRRQRFTPITQEELEKMYLDQEEFIRRGLEWDRKEQALIDEWKKKQREAIDNERKETKAIGEGSEFTPGTWDRKPKTEISTQADSEQKNLTIKNELVETKEEKKIVEGASSLPGKYIIEFHEEDRQWIKRQDDKMMAPFMPLINSIDWSKYTTETVAERHYKQVQEEREVFKQKYKELTNIGKRLSERKNKNNIYSSFREKFKDVFEPLEKM